MMCEAIKLLIVAFLWIVFDAQVEGYFSDVLNLEKVDLSVWHQRNPRVAIRTNDQLACEKPNIYICEVPPNVISIESTKTCNFRNVWFHEQVFRWVAGRGCLLYTPDFLFVGGTNPINLNAGCVFGHLFAPCLEIAKDDGTCACYPFDPSFEEVATAVRKALVPSIHGRWERCFYGASDCCSHYMNGEQDLQDKCPPTFDGWTCWPSAQNGSIARSVCPEFAYSNSGPTCHHFSHKECHPNGVWEVQTDYSTCSVTPRLLSRYRYYTGVLIFSVITSAPAIFIFIFYKRLRVTRVALHRNLLIAIVLRNIIVIISRNVIYMDELTNSGETIMSQNGVACRVLSVAERLAGNAVFVCMLLEGIYLHRLIVAVFRQKLNMKMLYSIGALYAILPVVAWSVVMLLQNDHSCWLVYTVPHVQWALDAPRLLVLVINAALYIDVLRVLFTKIRNSENANQLNTAKATLFLMPIFGVQFLFTVFRPNTTNCDVEQFYYFVAFTIEGLQGFIVALLYCYINKEVHALIKATYKKAEDTVTSRMRCSSNYPRMSGEATNTDRRFTYSSALNTNNADDSKNQYSTMKPKLHVAEIISIQASERLAEILDPVYETIGNGVTEGYDYLERSDADTDSGFIRNRNSKVDEYYGFTNASSVSIGCTEWLKCVSTPSNSIYNNSLTMCDVIQEETPGDTKQMESACSSNALPVKNETEEINPTKLNEYENVLNKTPEYDNIYNETELDAALQGVANMEIHCENYENMLDEIIQCMESKDNSHVKLNPDILSPNRPEGDKIVFVDD